MVRQGKERSEPKKPAGWSALCCYVLRSHPTLPKLSKEVFFRFVFLNLIIITSSTITTDIPTTVSRRRPSPTTDKSSTCDGDDIFPGLRQLGNVSPVLFDLSTFFARQVLGNDTSLVLSIVTPLPSY